jgi:hypothetical protein
MQGTSAFPREISDSFVHLPMRSNESRVATKAIADRLVLGAPRLLLRLFVLKRGLHV